MKEKSQEEFWRPGIVLRKHISEDEAKEIFGEDKKPDMILASQAAWDAYAKEMEKLKTRDHVAWIKWRFRG